MQIDKKLIVMFAEQIFHTGFVHADPHHGNIFVRRMAQGRGSMGSPTAEIVLIDHGLYECINENDRRALCKLWKYIILKDEAKMRHYSKLLNVNGKLLFLFSTRLSYVFDGNDTIRSPRCFTTASAEENFMVLATFLTMRPLHRPVHSKLVFSSDWLLMSDKERAKATAEGKMCLPSPKEIRKMKRDELNALRAKFTPFFEDIKEEMLVVFKSFPSSLILVCRYSTVKPLLPNPQHID